MLSGVEHGKGFITSEPGVVGGVVKLASSFLT